MTFRTVYSSQLTDREIRKIFLQKRYSLKASCRSCLQFKLFWISEKEFRCKNCWSVWSFTTETFLERSRLSLRLWYELLWCFTLSHAANKSGKLLGVDAKICWQTYQIIRRALVQDSNRNKEQITGVVEIDESFYGGVFKNLRKDTRRQYRLEGKAKRGRGAIYRKQPVFGIYRRNGSVYLELITECTKQELEPIIKKKIKKDTEVFSDALTSYNGLVGLGYVHKSVDHGMEIYVNGRVHINGMEGFWGLSKTNMHTYKGIKKKNWILYLKEMEFRYNNRKLNFSEIVEKLIAILMTYRKENFVPY
jgi:transposase